MGIQRQSSIISLWRNLAQFLKLQGFKFFLYKYFYRNIPPSGRDHARELLFFYEDRSLKSKSILNYLYPRRKWQSKYEDQDMVWSVRQTNTRGLSADKGRRRREKKFAFVSLTGEGPRPGRSQSRTFATYDRLGWIHFEFIYIFGAMWWMIVLASFQQGFVMRVYMYIGYYSTDDAHRGEVDRGGPVIKKITRRLSSRFISLSCSMRIQHGAKSRCEDVSYCGFALTFFIIIASRATEGEVKGQEEYPWPLSLSSFLDSTTRTKRGSSVLRSSGSLSPAATASAPSHFVVLSLHPKEPLCLEFHLGAIDYTLAWPMIITSFEQSFRTRE